MDPSASLAQHVLAGSVRHAGRLISQVENGHPEARESLRELAASCGRAQLVGITGPPGAGKSSLAAALTRELRQHGRTVGVVAVDPSSPFSGGALLGDRDRMLEVASGDPGVFIRSVASRGAQGGLAAAVNDAVDVLDAMGKDVVVIETVGVGQGELEIAKIAHTVLLVLVPGYGDSLQAMKAGITEIADVVVVNKGDTPGAKEARKELASQHYERKHPAGGPPWRVPVRLAAALRHEGISEVVETVDEHFSFTEETGWRKETELRRGRARFAAFVEDRLREELLGVAETTIDDESLADPYGAAEEYVARLLRAQHAITPGPARAMAEMEQR